MKKIIIVEYNSHVLVILLINYLQNDGFLAMISDYRARASASYFPNSVSQWFGLSWWDNLFFCRCFTFSPASLGSGTGASAYSPSSTSTARCCSGEAWGPTTVWQRWFVPTNLVFSPDLSFCLLRIYSHTVILFFIIFLHPPAFAIILVPQTL